MSAIPDFGEGPEAFATRVGCRHAQPNVPAEALGARELGVEDRLPGGETRLESLRTIRLM